LFNFMMGLLMRKALTRIEADNIIIDVIQNYFLS